MSDKQLISLKQEVLVRLIKAFFSNDFIENIQNIPYELRPKNSEVPYRCCIFKERAILRDRVIAGLGFSIEKDDEQKSLKNYAIEALERNIPEEDPLTILDIACKGCLASQVYITDLCQGCVARPCQKACRFGAINFEEGHSKIDANKCRKCKMCITACPYQAIVKTTVPCEAICPVGAIEKNDQGTSRINFAKCISCGQCVSACPFGAIHEKSQLIDVLKKIKKKEKVIAMIAPSIVGQFPGSIYQLRTALLKMGFAEVVEVAYGADITIRNEAQEFEERILKDAFMTTSCCAGYYQLLDKHLGEMKPYVSHTRTPVYYTAEWVKQNFPGAVTVFISPCVAKRKEGMFSENIDWVINYEELEALLAAEKIELLGCEDSHFKVESSKQGRGFGLSGGVAKSVACLSNQVKPCIINGLNKDSIKKLKQYAKEGNCPEGNLVEVMSCAGGCVGGNATISKVSTSARIINDFINQSKDIKEI